MHRIPRTALNRLTVSGFRNLKDQRLDLPPDGVALIGRNAQGKTNLLEAIYYLEIFRSFRGARDDQLTRFGESLFRVEAVLGIETDRGGAAGAAGEWAPPKQVAAAFQVLPREKKVTVDGDVVTRMADAIGEVGAVIFSPEDVRLVSDGPALRRRFLDVLLSLNRTGYLDALQRFRQVLAQRNAALRAGGEAAAAQAWNEVLIASGAEVSWARAAWIREHAGRFTEYTAEVSGTEGARMIYDSSIPPGEPDGGASAVRDAYRVALTASLERERRQGVTQVGPHRDDMRFLLGSSRSAADAREFGSGGQRRTIALALRLVEADAVRERRSREPILLLDDVFAELDEDRSRRVLGLLDRRVPGQVVLTAPKESDVRFREGALVCWQVEDGEVFS